MRNRRVNWWITGLTVAAFALAACSSDSTPASDPDTTSTPVTGTTTEPGRSDRPTVVWQVSDLCADSTVASDRIVVANCDGGVQAHARSDGTFLWGAVANDDGQSVPGITDDEVIVYSPFYGAQYSVAFDGSTGEEVEVPTSGVQTTYTGFDAPTDEVLPPGYSFDERGLSHRGTVIWPGGRPDVTGLGTYVHRQSGVTVINDFETGLRVVDDDGNVLLEPERAGRIYTNSPVWDIGNDQAVVSDGGSLYLLHLPPAAATDSVDPTEAAGQRQ